MPVVRSEVLPVRSETDIVAVRQRVRQATLEVKFSLIEQTKLVTAASELARNALDYGGGGDATIEILDEGIRRGIRITFVDKGPGIPDIEAALRDGFTTGGGLGHGLGGTRRLVEEFAIESTVGVGTRVTIGRWK